MPFVISLAGYRPSPRYPPIVTPWTQAQIAYAPTFVGPYVPFDTLALSPLDPDPTAPAQRNLTSVLAPAPSGFFKVTFLDAAGNQEPTNPVAFPPGGFTYSGDPTSSDQDAVRFETQDTDASAPLLQDAEVAWCILAETGTAAGAPATLAPGPLYAAAARCMEAISGLLAAQADTEVGDLKTVYSKQAVNYGARAKALRVKAQGFHAPFSGGQSVSRKQALRDDDDRVAPAFSREQFRNPWTGPEVPEFPVSNEPVP